MSSTFVAHDPTSLRNHLIAKKLLDQAYRNLPWYNSVWLCKYIAAKKMIERVRPDMLPAFINAFDRLKTCPDFSIRKLDHLFDDQVMEEIRETIRTLRPDAFEDHEAAKFGRRVVHRHPVFNALQKRVQPLVSELAGEVVEPSYNFLSLYSQFGVCPPHMDSPEAKWTLDLCIDQTEVWPIHFSQVVPWPEDFVDEGENWQDHLKECPNLRYTSYCLQPNEAVLFSGSSQWHYRDSLSTVGNGGFCNLLFFHFIPEGMGDIIQPQKWPELFGIPELAAVVEVRKRPWTVSDRSQ